MSMRSFGLVALGLLVVFTGPARAGGEAKAKVTAAAKAKTEITWYGHAAFGIKTPAGKTLLIDPWIDNPANPNGKDDLAKLTSVDLILVSHGHADHVGNAIELGKRTKAKLVATYDLGKALVDSGYPSEQAAMDTEGNFGGTVELLDGEVAITFVPAVHSSQVQKTVKTGVVLVDGGAPGGFVIRIKGGPAIYHTGDTDLFSDMALVTQDGPIDLMLACIGGHFTMDPVRAARAAKLVKPKQMVPMHFGTFPLLKGTPEALAKALRSAGVRTKPHPMKVGETLSL